ncbi:MAG TPA: VanZ family protein [Solirubrobacteraceae bacterium]
MRLVSRYAPPLPVMALIYALSAQPDLGTGLGVWDTVLRKLAHIAIFGVLWLALARATDWRRPVLATVIAVLYAISDEFHQTFVNDRHGSALDVAIDTIGMGLAALAWLQAARRRGGRPGPPWPLRA